MFLFREQFFGVNFCDNRPEELWIIEDIGMKYSKIEGQSRVKNKLIVVRGVGKLCALSE